MRSVHCHPSFIILLTACLMCINWHIDKLSIHQFTVPFITLWILWYLPKCFNQRWKDIIEAMLGLLIFICCIIDLFCQIRFNTHISPQIISNIFLSNPREIVEFFSTFVNFEVILNPRIIMWLFLLLLFISCYLYPTAWGKKMGWVSNHSKVFRGSLSFFKAKYLILPILFLFIYEIPTSYQFLQLFNPQKNINDLEGMVFKKYHQTLPTPLHRIIYSLWAVSRSTKSLENIKAATQSSQIVTCLFRSPHIVLIIGESYNKYHSSLYGYEKQTTPLQQSRYEKGELYLFDNVVSPWNITSNVFMRLFSTWGCTMEGELDKQPLFPFLFRKAGYEVNFYTNQYAMKGFAHRGTPQTGGFFLADASFSEQLFSHRNKKTFKYDHTLVNYIKKRKLLTHKEKPILDIIHLVGQHFDYSEKYPNEYAKFTERDYAHRSLGMRERETISHYDNACYYNDAVLNSILSLYEKDETIVIFLSDHGEEVYDDMPTCGRIFSTPDASIAKYEYEIPMWIWCSELYQQKHPDIIKQITASIHKPFLSDKLASLLFHLSGIVTPYYMEEHCPLSPMYMCKKRIICGDTDYDELCKPIFVF